MAQPALPKPASRILLLPLCLAFFAVWAHDVARVALTGDEAFIAILSRQNAREVLARLNSDEPHPPLYYFGMLGWQRLIGQTHEFMIRLPSLFAGLLVLSLTYRLGRELGLGPWGALSAAALLGLNPQLSVHVREARMYGPMILGVGLATWAAWQCAPARAIACGRTRVMLVAFASLLALFIHYFNSLFIAALGVWGLFVLRGRARRNWVLAQGLAWLALLGWMIFFGRGFFNPTSLNAGKTWSYLLPPWETLARLAAVGASGYRGYEQSLLPYLAAPLLVAGWLAGGGLARNRTHGLLLLMVGGPLLAYALLGMVRPVFHPKYMLPWLLFATLGVGALLQRWPRPGAVVALTLAACLIGPTWETVRRPYDPGLSVAASDELTSLPREVGHELLVYAGPNDLFGMATPDPAHCYYTEHYFGRSLGCELIPAYPNQPAAELARQIDERLRQHRLLWYLDFYNPAWDPTQAAAAALNQSAFHLGQAALAGRTLQLYAAPRRILAEQTRLGARFGDFAELEGAWVVRAQNLHVVLIWRSLADRPEVDAKVFVHLLGADGTMLAQADGYPVGWTRPLNTWARHEQIMDVYTLPLPAGVDLTSAQLRVGLYDPNTLERLPAFRGNERLAEDAAPIPLTLR